MPSQVPWPKSDSQATFEKLKVLPSTLLVSVAVVHSMVMVSVPMVMSPANFIWSPEISPVSEMPEAVAVRVFPLCEKTPLPLKVVTASGQSFVGVVPFKNQVVSSKLKEGVSGSLKVQLTPPAAASRSL